MDKDVANTVSALLRQLLDIVDGVGQEQDNTMDYEDESGSDSCGTGATRDGEQPDDLFVPPLQLKMELLKKAVGVENIYDDDETEDQERHSYDELELIKKNAGISSVAIISELSDEEPLES